MSSTPVISRRAVLLGTVVLASLAGCGASKFKTYSGPRVSSVQVFKAKRRMYLLSEDQKVLRKYRIGLGGNPVGHKQFEGDSKTPEGTYIIDRRNPNSAYYLSLGISYPNSVDRAYAAAQGKKPGGDIFIHGEERKSSGRGRDWTAGCIAVKNREIEEIYAMVGNGTPIHIFR
ncbi:L,D-transpeptidase family protein [Thioclava sp. A2]|uniref:L,D-transpeptidase family protein n=1 Tax=Thioclava sp. FCG-A2 TaxID=3080562 RepID=UPI00295322D3|nr:L,D-transpeptidase family protein [Thioclava sp. A2]MDV7270526.1 L,D-transpeptidase family protein [Thioclava sp. A2]